ncbi:hypothetical protein Tco_0600754 [Tanacetum coccineum]
MLAAATTVPPSTLMISSLPLQSTPTPTPTTESTTTSIPELPNFSSLFGFDQRVSTLEKELTRVRYAAQTALQSYTVEFEKKAQAKRRTYINLVENSVKDIIKNEVTSQLPQILQKEVSNFATPMIQSTRDRKDEDKDVDPPAGSNQGLKKRKTSKNAEPSKGLKSKESRSSSSSKGTKSQPKSSGTSTQAEDIVIEAADTKILHNQGDNLGNSDDQANVEATSRTDWFKKLERPPTHDSEWNTRITVDSRPPQIDNLTQEILVGPAFNLLKGIEVMVPTLWSLVKVAFDRYAMRIITATKVKVMKCYDYGHLEEIEVQRDDQKLYKFMEGDFPRLNLLMRSDELYKFCDGTLTSVRSMLQDIASNLNMDYLPPRRWSNLDKKRSRIMNKAIDKPLFERRLMRNLEKFVSGREYREDFRLLERTI